MSLEMTFRQKLIRIACSAAVCGLSFSFIVGEAVDGEAKRLRSWVSAPSLFPRAYLPLRPLRAALGGVAGPAWRDHLASLNSLEMAPPVGTISPTTADTPLDVIKVARAAPLPIIAVTRPEVLLASEGETIKSAELEEVLVSLHDATTKLSSGAQHGPQLERSASVEARPEAPKEARSPEEWALQGRILTSTEQSFEGGHFEVGLFSKIDDMGNPLGPPKRQEILPAGRTSFRLRVPADVGKGYLFGEFVETRSGKRTLLKPSHNPFVRGPNQPVELIYRAGDVLSSIAATASKVDVQDAWKITGNVTTMFVSGGTVVPQADVVLKVRGRKESTRTDRLGNFSLRVPRMQGTLFLEVLKAGYHPSVVSVASGDPRPIKIEIASRNAIQQIAQKQNVSQSSALGAFVGRITAETGAGIRDATVQLSMKADGPYYFNDEGHVDREARSTSSDGRFLFLNVEAGTGYLEVSVSGEAISPVQVSCVEGGELIHKSMTPATGSLRGRIFNPVDGKRLVPVVGAKVRMDGASGWVSSDSFGAFSIGPIRWMKGERIALEVSAERFNNHRYLVSPVTASAGSGLSLFVFPAAYIARLAKSMDIDLDPYAGMIVGKVTGPSLRIDAMTDHSAVNNARDFYFDAAGRLRGSHEMTDPRFGTYVIFNVPKGKALLQGNDSAGVLRYADAIFAGPSSVNVVQD